jgi:hypothetical protein
MDEVIGHMREKIELPDNYDEIPQAERKRPTCAPEDYLAYVCGKVSKGKVITRKPILPSVEELEVNSRSKSAKLRVFEKKIKDFSSESGEKEYGTEKKSKQYSLHI